MNLVKLQNTKTNVQHCFQYRSNNTLCKKSWKQSSSNLLRQKDRDVPYIHVLEQLIMLNVYSVQRDSKISVISPTKIPMAFFTEIDKIIPN